MIGHSDHQLAPFIANLKKNGIKTLFDVRTSAFSRYQHFIGAKLRGQLAIHEIRYEHIPKLGGKPALPKAAVRSLISQINPPPNTAMMCSEGNHLECHRHYHLAPVMLAMGYEVVQILKDGSTFVDNGPSEKTLKKMSKYLPVEDQGHVAEQLGFLI